ncbi:DUF7670 domain-containing protein [Oceanithermus desulfurans]|uniref:Tryptophan-rich sensory protein n=2 Tax=Oceanithermus desulfurans TaxID=227924 RepID=A0A511RL03_9DEIN|nr:hypothetical protein [Oceanithermus desulfurans]MBB6030743.1 hypothetical protein [Oceanithermus desulfurans]GEM90329.1 hypothetical protein ODE01S_17630 [Oceanithermus desulfurans NBRC 100063]
MPETDRAADPGTERLRRTARAWALTVIVFVFAAAMLALWNRIAIGRFDPRLVAGTPAVEFLPPLLTLASAAALLAAWRREWVGGLAATALQLATLPLLLVRWPPWQGFPRHLLAPYGVWLWITVPGVLFLVCAWRSRRSPPDRG